MNDRVYAAPWAAAYVSEYGEPKTDEDRDRASVFEIAFRHGVKDGSRKERERIHRIIGD